jgi:hypothetical protein
MPRRGQERGAPSPVSSFVAKSSQLGPPSFLLIGDRPPGPNLTEGGDQYGHNGVHALVDYASLARDGHARER